MRPGRASGRHRLSSGRELMRTLFTLLCLNRFPSPERPQSFLIAETHFDSFRCGHIKGRPLRRQSVAVSAEYPLPRLTRPSD